MTGPERLQQIWQEINASKHLTADQRNRLYQSTIEREFEALYERQAALLEAASAFESGLSEYCDGPERDALQAAIAAVEGAA